MEFICNGRNALVRCTNAFPPGDSNFSERERIKSRRKMANVEQIAKFTIFSSSSAAAAVPSPEERVRWRRRERVENNSESK